MTTPPAQEALETYKKVRRKFFDAGDFIFGPGVMSMAEHYFTNKTGKNPFSLMFSEPAAVYEEWVIQFKGDKTVEALIERAIGPDYERFMSDMKRNDALKVWSALDRLVSSKAIASSSEPLPVNLSPPDRLGNNVKVGGTA
ncbi:MAG: hypothetical protein ABI361_07405 [Nitrososphaera sp.]|jgi:hypothetical protein